MSLVESLYARGGNNYHLKALLIQGKIIFEKHDLPMKKLKSWRYSMSLNDNGSPNLRRGALKDRVHK